MPLTTYWGKGACNRASGMHPTRYNHGDRLLKAADFPSDNVEVVS
jgi:hypothetical protein